MNTFVALLRGINVGGHGRLLMKDLRAILEGLGLTHVRTYLQSGNAVFRSESDDCGRLAEDIGAAIHTQCGWTPDVLVLTREELQAAIDTNPFLAAEDEPKSLHLFFMKTPPKTPDLAKLDALRTASERYKLSGTIFYLHAPDGLARSRLAAQIEKALGVAGTARNWRSVRAVMALAQEID